MTVQFQQLALDVLVDAGDNVRTDLGDLTDLAASIREHGIMQPIVVDADMRIVSGHRRYAAARLAGRTDVPVLVNDEIDEVTRLEMMIVENLQRTDLSPFEEAAAFRRLMDLGGHSQRKVADRIGCAQAHVSRRLTLLQLPEPARELVLAGDLTIEDALVLARATAEELARLFVDDRPPQQWEIHNTVGRVRHREEVDAARKKAAKSGLPDVEEQWSHSTHEVCDQENATGWMVRGSTILWVRERPVSAPQPRSASEAADDLDEDDPAGITPVRPVDDYALLRCQLAALGAALKAVETDRKAFIRAWLADRKNWYGTTAKQRTAFEHVALVTAELARDENYADSSDVAELLGLDDVDALSDIDLDGPEDRLKVALAFALAVGEQVLGWASPVGASHLHFLAELGRPIEPIEQRRYIDGITEPAQLVTEFDIEVPA